MAVVDAVSESTPASTRRRSLPVSEWAVVVGAGLVLVTASPQVSATYWSPKTAIVLVGLGPGVVALLLAARARDRAALAGLGFVLVAWLATVWSPAPALAVTGLYNNGGGWLFVTAVVAAWALGRRLSPVGARRLGDVIIVAATANAVMAWLQMARVYHGDLSALTDGRAPGLMGNPAHLAAFMVGAAALLGARWVEGRRVRRADATNSGWTRADLLTAALMMLIGSAVQFSGGRIGVALLVLVLLIVAFRAGLRAAVPVAVAIVLGVGIAAVALPADGSGATDRVNSASSSSISGRIDRWAMAVDAVADRPIVGIGPGLYRRATSPYDTVAAASAFGSDRLNRDAHNVFVEYLVTTGVVGLLALVVWLALASRRARGPLAAFALVGSLSLLLQPLWIGLTPVLALALGAADRRESVPFRRPSAIAAGVIGVVGVVAAVLLLHGDAEFARALRDRNPTTAASATRALALWPEPAIAEANLWAHPPPGSDRVADWSRALAAGREAVRRDPSETLALTDLARNEFEHGSRSAARAAYLSALRWDPASVQALLGLARVDERAGHPQAATRRCEAARAMVPRVNCRVYLGRSG